MELIAQSRGKSAWGKFFAVMLCIAIMEVYYRFMELSQLLTGMLAGNGTELEQMTLKEFFYTVCALCIAFICGRTPADLFGSKKGRLYTQRRRYAAVLLAIQMTGAFIFRSVMLCQKYTVRTLRPFGEIVLFSVYMLLIGISEEVIFRGVISESMKNIFRDTGKGAVISGILFGIMHLINLRVAEPMDVAVQAINAAAAGIMLADIYYYTGTLWTSIILHAAVDFGGLLGFGLYGLGSLSSAISDYTPIMALPALLYMVMRIGLCKAINISIGNNTNLQSTYRQILG